MSYKFLLAICVYLPFQLAISPTPEIDLASIRNLIILLFFSWILEGLENKKIIKLLVWGAGLSAIIGLVQFIIQFVAGLDYSMKLWSLVIRPFLGTAFSQAVMDNPSWLVNLSGKTVFRAVSLFPDPHML